MKKFVKYIFGIILILVSIMYLLDFIYNSVYQNGAYRNKVMWIHDLKNNSLDFVIFGSSRANNYVMPNVIYNKTGQQGLNLGIQASGPLELELAIREYLKNNWAKRIFVQVDYTYNKETPDKTGQLSWLPYIVNNDVFKVFKPYGKEYSFYKYIPFYRYQMFDSRIGYRNVLLSKLNKGLNYYPSHGYTESTGKLKKDKPYKFSLKDKPNPHFISINEICKAKKIEVIYFTSPIYRPEGNFIILEKQLSNYYDFSNELQNMELYTNPVHLNKQGASIFTELFVEVFFSNNIN
jgi:hypothetical protein